MEVEDGYVLTASDYPSGTGMSYITWEQYTSPIHSDITINGSYSWGGMSADENAELADSSEGGEEGAAVAAAATTTTTVTDTDYTYNGGQLTGEVITTTVDGTATNTETLYYSYDAGGTPVSVKYNNTLYFYVTNLQGDVLAIMNASGTTVVEYTYDAWGHIRNTTGTMAETLGKANALRYRSYVYDTETGLYYLQSRYYNPGTGRFINADALVAPGQGLLGNNMFAYCNNNPVVMYDPAGCAPLKNLFPVCLGGTSTPPKFVGTSDGDEKSELLLQDIMAELNEFDVDWYPFSGNTVYVSVSPDGIYENYPNFGMEWVLLGVSVATAFIPELPLIITVILAGYSGIGIISDMRDPLPNREYYQYSVKMTWTSTKTHCGVMIYTTHCIEQIYIWNDTEKNNQYWYLYSQNYTATDTMFMD